MRISREFSKDSSHSSCNPLLCFAFVFHPKNPELRVCRGGWVEFLPVSWGAPLEEKPQELVTAIEHAFHLCSSGLLVVGQTSPPQQTLHCDLASVVEL